jgi:hypothetical protein
MCDGENWNKFHPISKDWFYEKLAENDSKGHKLYLEWSNCSPTFNFGNIEREKMRVMIPNDIISIPKDHPAYRKNGYWCSYRSNYKICYWGYFIIREGEKQIYIPIILLFIPTENDSDLIEYPEICACHGKKIDF